MRFLNVSWSLLVFFFVVNATAAEYTADEIEAQRKDVIRYGTDTEILKLVSILEEEKAEYLDDELASVLETTKNGKIESTLFGYFARKKATVAEARALRTVRDRDSETNEAVEAAIEYLGKIESQEAPAALREIIDAEETRFITSAVLALGRTGRGDAENNAAFLMAYYEEREVSDSVKQVIVSALGDLRSRSATSFLNDLARNSEEKPVRRMAALEAIGKVGDPESLEAVIEALAANDPNIRASAVAALSPFSDAKADAAILEAFRDSFYKTRAAAAKASGEKKIASAVPYLSYRAERDEVPSVREEALRALGAIGTEESISAVRSIFSEKKNADRIRISAAEVLLQRETPGSAREVLSALEDAKKEKKKDLYKGLVKVLAIAKSDELEDFARSLLASDDLTDKLYGLDLARTNTYRSLEKEIEKLSLEKNAVLSRRAKDVLSAFGSSE